MSPINEQNESRMCSQKKTASRVWRTGEKSRAAKWNERRKKTLKKALKMESN
jgi:hypothetical protein